MAANPVTPEMAQRIKDTLADAAERRTMLIKGIAAGVATEAQLKAHDDAIAKLLAIKQQFIDHP